MSKQTLFLYVAFGFTLSAGQDAAADCWPELYEKHVLFYNLIFDDDVETSIVETARSEMGAALRKCSPNETFARDMSNRVAGVDSYLTLVDFAILANDVELTAALLERLESDATLRIDPMQLEYGGAHLEIAAVVESSNVVRWLKEKIRAVDDFLISGNREIPNAILDVCTLDRSSQVTS